MDKGEVIINLGAEGGSIALYGVRTSRGWVFTMEVDDWTPELLDEEPLHTNLASVETWPAALELLDKYHWSKFFPLFIHPEFRRKIWEAVQVRLPKKAETAPSTLNSWRDACRDD
jgi:hypothetical protein